MQDFYCLYQSNDAYENRQLLPLKSYSKGAYFVEKAGFVPSVLLLHEHADGSFCVCPDGWRVQYHGLHDSRCLYQ